MSEVGIFLNKDFFIIPASVIVFKKNDNAVAIDGYTKQKIAEGIDHTEVIQKAIDHVAGKGGGKVYIKKGSFTISDTIHLKSNIILDGEYPTLYMDWRINLPLIEGVDIENVMIKHLIFDRGATWAEGYNDNAMEVKIYGSNNIVISHNYFLRSPMFHLAIGLSGTETNKTIKPCNNVLVHNNYFAYGPKDGIHLLGSKSVIISNNIFNQLGDDAIAIVGTADYKTSNISLHNNAVADCRYGMLRIRNISPYGDDVITDVVVNGNVARNVASELTQGAIMIDIRDEVSGYTPIRRIIVANNTIYNVQNIIEGAIYIDGKTSYIRDVVVLGNVIDSVGGSGSGVKIKYCKNVLVSKNILRKAKASGIVTAYSDDIKIAGNFIYLNEERGIYAVSMSRLLILNNYIHSNSQSGDNSFDNIYLGAINLVYVKNNIILPGEQTNKPRYGILFANNTTGVIIGNVLESGVTGAVGFSNQDPTLLVIKCNQGYITENSGVAILSGDGSTSDFLIGSHGLSPSITDPSKVVVKCTPASPDAIAASPLVCYLSDENADGKYESIRVKFSSAPPSGTDNVKVAWEVEYIG